MSKKNGIESWLERMRSYDPNALMRDVIRPDQHRVWKDSYLNQTVDLTIRKALLHQELYREGSAKGLKGIKLVDYCVDRVARLR